jgi:hypothetical protein
MTTTTTTTTTGRRALSFASLAEVMLDVDRLLQGHTTIGRWSLGQICKHLSMAIVGSVEGYPEQAPWMIRKTIGPIAKRHVLTTGTMPEGVKIPERYQPKPGADARAEAEALRAAIHLYSAHGGPLADHPLVGPLDRDQWTRFHCIHCAHHLSFALPGD